MKRVARAHRVALMGLLLLGVILVPRVGMGLHTVRADASTESNASTGSGSSDTPTATPTPAMEIPSVTATPTAMTAPEQATMMPTAVVSASATAVSPNATATNAPLSAPPEATSPKVTKTPSPVPPQSTAMPEPTMTTVLAVPTEPMATTTRSDCSQAPKPASLAQAITSSLLNKYYLFNRHYSMTYGITCDSPFIKFYPKTPELLEQFIDASPEFKVTYTYSNNNTQLSVDEENKPKTPGKPEGHSIQIKTQYLCQEEHWVLVAVVAKNETTEPGPGLQAQDEEDQTLHLTNKFSESISFRSNRLDDPKETSCPIFTSVTWHQGTAENRGVGTIMNTHIKQEIVGHSIIQTNETDFKSPNKAFHTLASIRSAKVVLDRCPGLLHLTEHNFAQLLQVEWPQLLQLAIDRPVWNNIESYKTTDARRDTSRINATQNDLLEIAEFTVGPTNEGLRGLRECQLKTQKEEKKQTIATDGAALLFPLQERTLEQRFATRKFMPASPSQACPTCEASSLASSVRMFLTPQVRGNDPIIGKDLWVESLKVDPLEDGKKSCTTEKDFDNPKQFVPFDTNAPLSEEAKFFIDYQTAVARLNDDPFFWRDPLRPAIPFDNNWMYPPPPTGPNGSPP